MRDASYGKGFGLVMMLFGQFNVFRRAEARAILERAHSALVPGGRLLLEPQTYETVRSAAASGPSWYSAASGLFSDTPHLCLTETFWDATAETSTTRFFVVDAATAEVTRHALSNEAYTEPQLAALLRDVGFESVEVMPSLVGGEDESQAHSFAVVATR